MAQVFAKSGDPDQTPPSVASDPSLHFLPSTLLGVSRLQWVKTSFIHKNALCNGLLTLSPLSLWNGLFHPWIWACWLMQNMVSIKNRMVNSVDPDEMTRFKPPHMDLHCLDRYMFWSAGLKERKWFIYKINCFFFFAVHCLMNTWGDMQSKWTRRGSSN